MSRHNRLNGLLNVVDFRSHIEYSEAPRLLSILHGAEAWIAFNVTVNTLLTLAELANASAVARVVFVVDLRAPSLTRESQIQLENLISQLAVSYVHSSFAIIYHNGVAPDPDPEPEPDPAVFGLQRLAPVR